MNVKISILSLVLMAGATSLFADNNDKGIDYYKAGMYSYAKKALFENIQSGKTDKAEAYYYLGEIYAAENMKDSAAYCYKQGLVADPEYVFNTIGEIKLDLAATPDVDKVLAGFTTGKNKKNPAIFVAIARAYMTDPARKAKVEEYLAKAKEVGPKSPDVYILEGDLLAADKKIGDAASSYEQAIYFDDQCKEAYLKYARIYARTNPQLAIDMLNKLIALDPEYTIAYRDLASVYYENNQFKSAADAYSKYITPETSDIDDLSRYASILFFSGEHEQAQQIIDRVSARAPENPVMQRLNMYIAYDKGDFAKSLELAQKMMQNTDTTSLIGRDYLYYARVLGKNNMAAEALVQYENAIAKDTANVALYKEMAEVAEKANLTDQAISYYTDYIQKGGEEVKIADYFSLGQTYYIAASAFLPQDNTPLSEADSLKMMPYALAADSLFGYVAERVPDSYMGNFWRARTNSVIDHLSTAGLAKPYYEKAIELIDPEKNPKQLLEAYRYMAYYYYLQEDRDNSLKYCDLILGMAPDDAMATAISSNLRQ